MHRFKESLLLKVHRALMSRNFHHQLLFFIGLFTFLAKTYQRLIQMLYLNRQISSSFLLDYELFVDQEVDKNFELSLYKVFHSFY